MSLKTWKEEFYPITAALAAESTRLDDKKKRATAMLEHSLKKWIGLRPENLDKHSVKVPSEDLQCVVENTVKDTDVAEEESISINGATCALCAAYLSWGEDHECRNCPLFQSEGIDCDGLNEYGEAEEYVDDSVYSPYLAFVDHRKVEPMIDALKRAIEDVETKDDE